MVYSQPSVVAKIFLLTIWNNKMSFGFKTMVTKLSILSGTNSASYIKFSNVKMFKVIIM